MLRSYQCPNVIRKSFAIVMIKKTWPFVLKCIDFFSPGFMPSKSKLRVGPRVFFLLEEPSKSNNEIIRNVIYSLI